MKPKNKISERYDAEAAEDAYFLRKVQDVRQRERSHPNPKSIAQRDKELRELLDDILAD